MRSQDYLVFYFVAVFALGFFSIANMPYNAAFTENGQGVGDGLAWSMAVAFQAGVLGDYEMVRRVAVVLYLTLTPVSIYKSKCCCAELLCDYEFEDRLRFVLNIWYIDRVS